jgi:hypothetical protein
MSINSGAWAVGNGVLGMCIVCGVWVVGFGGLQVGDVLVLGLASLRVRVLGLTACLPCGVIRRGPSLSWGVACLATYTHLPVTSPKPCGRYVDLMNEASQCVVLSTGAKPYDIVLLHGARKVTTINDQQLASSCHTTNKNKIYVRQWAPRTFMHI